MTRRTALEQALVRERAIVLGSLLTLTALAWAYVIWLAPQMTAPSMPNMADMPDMPGMDMSDSGTMAPAFAPWTPVHFLFMFTMWTVMMVGMMTPSVAPMILVYAQVARQSATRGQSFAPAGWFAAGYLVAWTLFALTAALAQWGLEAFALVTPMRGTASRVFGGLLLIVAGVYQWLPIKDACLSQCRAPLSFVMSHGGFQPNVQGSLRLGFLHGMYCIGCCWMLMLMLFVGGVMNLLWIAALMIFVLLEKVLPGGRYFSRATGLAAVAVGVIMVAR